MWKPRRHQDRDDHIAEREIHHPAWRGCYPPPPPRSSARDTPQVGTLQIVENHTCYWLTSVIMVMFLRRYMTFTCLVHDVHLETLCNKKLLLVFTTCFVRLYDKNISKCLTAQLLRSDFASELAKRPVDSRNLWLKSAGGAAPDFWCFRKNGNANGFIHLPNIVIVRREGTPECSRVLVMHQLVCSIQMGKNI